MAERAISMRKLIDPLQIIHLYLFLSRENDDDIRDIRKHNFC